MKPKAPAPLPAPQTAPAPVARVAVEASVSAAAVLPVLAAWQKTREAIGRVQCSTPDQISAAMAVLASEAKATETAVQELIRHGFLR